ncbi:Protein Tax-1 [Physocladia obscura]|uniref:Protein Tax-1 n=1 Tax=Physocladia obscura TaxID=109957 RepID=A0AAD5T8B0_9FUNG|nr:Protein Tax-1 [Physocladia obscura]
MYKVEIPIDRLQQAAISRRQKLDTERKTRIFDPKTRIIGIDVKALDEQVRIKNESKQLDQARDAAYHQYSKYTTQILSLMDNQTASTRRLHLQDMNDFRAEKQAPFQSRDFDLIDPDARKKDKPARAGDSDPRCGVSGLQQFEGEDLGEAKRRREQRAQMKTWVEREMWEKKCRDNSEAEEKRRYEEYQNNVALKAKALQQSLVNAKRNQRKADNAFNQSLAAQKKQREAEDKERTSQQNMQEIINNVNGVFLTETPNVTEISGGHKIRVDLFKGITKEQKDEMFQIQAYQREQNERKRQQERDDEARYALQETSNRRGMYLLEREKERQTKAMAVQIRRENEMKAGEDRTKWEYINRVLYTNPPTKAFFEQFNTTSR